MDTSTLDAVLNLIRPGAQRTIHGKKLDDGSLSADLVWHDEDQAQPTEQELRAGLMQLTSLAYREERAKAYPPIGDQLDALWKGGSALDEMKTTVEAVKAKYPKP